MKIQKGKLESQCVSFILPRRHMLTLCRLLKGVALQVDGAVDGSD